MKTARPRRAPAFSCDTLVSFSGSGASRRVVFGKNSDRSWTEAQPLTHVPAATHPAGATVRCQYLTIPQALETLAVLGSRPWWLWGFEQGVNSAGVAIGNEAIYTRDEVPSIGLLGMDLVRLGLERGRSAAEAKRVICELIEQYGQGGAAMYLTDTRYHSSFIIADADEAYVLETSGRRWVTKRVTSSVAIANLITIEDDFDEASPDLEEHAREQGWWNEPYETRFDFRAAYEDPQIRGKTEARYQQSCRYLGGSGLTVSTMMRHLRDHFDGGLTHIPDISEDHSRPRSICLHPEPWANGGTAASMIVDLTAARRQPVTAWCSMAPPCTGVFMPIPVGTPLPDAWTIGSDIHDDASVWWALHDLAEGVERDYAALTPYVQQAWGSWERQLLAATPDDDDPAALRVRTERLLDMQRSLMGELRPSAVALG